MSSDESSFDLSYLNPSEVGSSPSERGKRAHGYTRHKLAYSTPVAKSTVTRRNNHKISPVDVSELTSTSTPRSPRPNTQNSNRRPMLNKNDIPDSMFESHPELNMAMLQQGSFNPIKGARVLFSPKGENNPYRTDFKGLRNASVEELDYSTLDKSNDLELDYSTLDKSNDLEEINIREIHGKEPKGANEPSDLANIPKMAQKQSIFTDPNTPYVLSLYLQLAFNLLIVSLIAFLVFIFVKTIQSDIRRKIELYTSDILEEISSCTREYFRNKCSPPEDMAPWLEPSCTKWKKCMNSDPELIARSKITAETFADIVNGFIKPISWKSLIFLNLMVWGSLLATNIGFGTFRANSKMIEQDNVKLRAKVKEFERMALLLEKDQTYKNDHKLIEDKI